MLAMISLPYPCCDFLYAVNSFTVDKAYLHKHKQISIIIHSKRMLNCKTPKETILTHTHKCVRTYTVTHTHKYLFYFTLKQEISGKFTDSEILIFPKR